MLLLISLILVATLTQGAPLYGEDYSGRIADEYIVIYNDDISSDLIFAHQDSLSLNIMHTYNISQSYRGFSAHLTKQELNKVLSTPFVKEVHCNGIVSLFCSLKEPVLPWGIARVSTQGKLTQKLVREFNHNENLGKGVNIYILDTGVNEGHEQFTGRVTAGFSFITGEDKATVDLNGHGTHCAGTAAGDTVGIAREATITPVKVLGASGSGAFSGVIAGIQWAAKEFVAQKIPSIASMSLGATTDGGMNGAVESAIQLGLPFSIAAGNSNADACRYYPASAKDAITVGSTALGTGESSDIISSFSNWGPCVEIFAPGTTIYSSYIPDTNSYRELSGTSMACPHVAGLSAVILGQRPEFTPADLTRALVETANDGCVLDPKGSPNKLLFNGCTPTN